MGRRGVIAGTAAVSIAAMGLASPAAAAHPGENGMITYTAEVQFSVPCLGSPVDEPRTPLSLEASGGHAWSPDGRSVALVGVPPDTSEQRLVVVVVEDCSHRDLGPADGPGVSWSPDGTRIAGIRGGDVVVVSAATGEVVGAVTATPGFAEREPSWSPTDEVIAYTGAGGVHVAPVDGSNPAGTLLVPGGSHPDFSPDGERLVYSQGPSLADRRIAHARAADGGDEVLLPPALGADHVVWSPDGDLFLVAGSLLDEEGSPQQDCYTTTVDGSQVRALGVVPSPCSRPAWQPLPEQDVPELTLVYVYPKVDPMRRPSWGNSGTQSLVSVSTGHAWVRSLDPADLPDGVCGPGWAVQTDFTVGLRRDEVPQTIDRSTWTNVLGWGTVVKAARHHSLEYHLRGPVPACPTGSETAG